MKNFVLTILFLYLCSVSFPQSISKYRETNNQLLFDISFQSIPYQTIRERESTVVKFGNYQDESDPGNYALPSKEVIIALPSFSKVSVQMQILEKNRIEGKPLVNPLLELKGDGSVVYKNVPANQISLRKELFEIKGYLWLKGYYCVHLKINQYQFNNDIIEELTKGSLVVNILSPGNNLTSPKYETEKDTIYLASIISNYDHAVSLNKEVYAPNTVDYSWIDFSKTYVKIGTNHDGLYRINKASLETLGINVSSINSSTFSVYLKGKEIPITVRDNGSNQLGDNGYIEFFGLRNMGDNYREVSATGEAYKEYLNRYSDTSIYWLTWGGNIGLRADSVSNFTGTPQDTLLYYSEIAHYENNLWLDYSFDNETRRQFPQWKENQTWVEGQQAVGTSNRPFTAIDIFPNKTVKAFYKIQDYASDVRPPVYAHKVGLSINSDPAVYDSVSFYKFQQRVVKAEFNSSLLTEGQNTLKAISYPTAASLNAIAVDWHEVEYPRYSKAVNDSLLLVFNDITSKSLQYIKITNFTASNPVIYKYTQGTKRITNYTMNGDVIVFADTVSPGDRYFIIGENKITAPFFFYKKNFTDLADVNNRADYILITHPSFLQTAGQYVNYIAQTYNLQTKLISVFDIYDQFNYGFFSPEPIKDFLVTANLKWQNPKPQYLFLVGDANYDYYSYKNKYFQTPKVANLVPSFGEPVSDTWFVIWDSTALIPQMYIGRLPAADNVEFIHFFDKHKKYVSEPFDDWNKYYLFFSSGDSDKPSELDNIKRINDNIINNDVAAPPVSGIAHHLYKTFQPRTNFGPYTPDQITNMIGLGGVFTCYIGHSGTQVWDNGISDVRQLHNFRNKLSLYSDFGCSTGRFAEPDIKAFGELFVNGLDGEAIGYTGNSSLGYLTDLPQLFYKRLLKDNIIEFGKAHVMAKIDLLNLYGSNDVSKVLMYSNTLFSDPVIKLATPQKPNLVVTSKDISLDVEFPDDSIDSVAVKGSYFNYGIQDSRIFNIEVTHLLNGLEQGKLNFAKSLPGLKDSVLFYLPVKGSVGNHTLLFKIDSNNDVDEIYENDNNLTFTFNVASNSARVMTTELINNLTDGKFRVVNPVTKPASDSLVYEVSGKPDFSNLQIYYKKLDTVYTKVSVPGLEQGKRYWFRSKLNSNESEYSNVYSFIYDSTAQFAFFIGDTVSYKTVSTDALNITPDGISLTKFQKDLRVISAGKYDGSFAIIEVNGNNYVPSGHLEGIHVVVLKDTTLEYLGSERFNYWENVGTSFLTNLSTFLDTVSSSNIVGFAFSGSAGIGIPDSIKAKIRNFGSVYIDSVKLNYSWALIGKKGSPVGSRPEKMSRPFQGNVTADSVLTLNLNSGTVITGELGPVHKWKNMVSQYSVSNGSNITFQPIGIKSDGTIDTLQLLNVQNGIADLSGLSSYESLKMIIRFSRTDTTTAILNTIRLNYEPLNEVGTNYQVVSIQKDTVLIGEYLNLNYKLYNCGFTPAENFKVRVERIVNNTREIVKEDNVTSLGADSSLSYSATYNSASGSGPAVFSVSIDPENKLKEYFKDNNIYSLPVFVKNDTTHPLLSLTFNGSDISDGEYISSNPLIRVELNDPSLLPVTDTSAILIKLNNEPVYYLNNPDISITFNNNNPKVVLEYKPTLKDGEYVLNVTGKNSSGTLTDSSGIEKRFIVNQEPKLLNVFNYPNPFKESTWFTFKVTQIPDEIKIRIYTIAGRLIKEISRNSSDLKFDFNKIYWDGKDQDGDNIANGLYLYKIIMKKGDKSETLIEKIVVLK